MLRTAMLFLSLCLIPQTGRTAESVKADSPSVTKRIGVARELTIALQRDADEMAAQSTGSADLHALPSMQKRISGDMRKAKETIDELMETQKIASPAQSAVIQRVTPLLRDLVENTRNMLDHLTASPVDALSDKSPEYIQAHLEIAKHLTSQILETLDQRKEPLPTHF